MRAVLVASIAALAASPAAAAPTRAVHFQSPSGNINCILDAGFADCFVKRQSWRVLPRRPASCDLDWFPAEISAGPRGVRVGSCRGDIGPACLAQTPHRCRTLAYGASVASGAMRCRSALDGVTCRRTDGRRVGFRIAREGYVLFR